VNWVVKLNLTFEAVLPESATKSMLLRINSKFHVLEVRGTPGTSGSLSERPIQAGESSHNRGQIYPLTIDILFLPWVMCADLKDYQLDSSLTTNAEKWTRVVESKSYNKAVICQKRMFPYAVYQCQDMKISGTGPQATIYSISMEEINNNNGEVAPSSNSPRINQVAICGHINDLDLKLDDTSSKHVEAGEFDRTCHWVSDAFIWGIRAAI
jgi:hypothetical protein